MQRVIVLLAVCVGMLGFSLSPANAGLVITIESSAGGGPVTVFGAPPAGPNSTAVFIGVLPGFSSITALVTSTQSGFQSNVTDVALSATRNGSGGNESLTLTAQNDEFTLPAGSLLLLASTATLNDSSPQSGGGQSATFDSTFEDFDGPAQSTAQISLTGPVDSDLETAQVVRDTSPFTLSNVLVFTLAANESGITNASTSVTNVIPEAGSLIAWSLAVCCACFVGWRRKLRR